MDPVRLREWTAFPNDIPQILDPFATCYLCIIKSCVKTGNDTTLLLYTKTFHAIILAIYVNPWETEPDANER